MVFDTAQNTLALHQHSLDLHPATGAQRLRARAGVEDLNFEWPPEAEVESQTVGGGRKRRIQDAKKQGRSEGEGVERCLRRDWLYH